MKNLETNRLLLRHLAPDDLDNLYALDANQDVRRCIPDTPCTLAETKEELDWFLLGHPTFPELGLWATVNKDTNEFIGRCGLLLWVIKCSLRTPFTGCCWVLKSAGNGNSLASRLQALFKI